MYYGVAYSLFLSASANRDVDILNSTHMRMNEALQDYCVMNCPTHRISSANRPLGKEKR